MKDPVELYRVSSITKMALLAICEVMPLHEGIGPEGRYYCDFDKDAAVRSLALIEANPSIQTFFKAINTVKRRISAHKKSIGEVKI